MRTSSFTYMDADLLKLIKRIKHLRTEKGWSQAELANRMGKDKQSIQRLEQGKVNPGFLFLRDVASVLNISLSQLMDVN